MDLVQIPFSRHLGITRNEEELLQLPFSEILQNHLGIAHGSAVVALAETAGGDYLNSCFPEITEPVIPVLRNAEVKFRKPVNKTITAFPSAEAAERDRFKEELSGKGRSFITVRVEIRDAAGEVNLVGRFTSFIKKAS